MHTLPLLPPKPKHRIRHPPAPLQPPLTPKPPHQLLLRPITARHDQHAPRPHQPLHPAPVPLADPPARPVHLVAQTDRVKSALVEHDVEAGQRPPRGRRRGEDFKGCEFHRSHVAAAGVNGCCCRCCCCCCCCWSGRCWRGCRSDDNNPLLSGPPFAKFDAGGGIVHADHAAREAAGLAEEEEHGAVAGAEVEEGGGLFGEGGGRAGGVVGGVGRGRGGGQGEEVGEDLLGGVGVVEPCLARVGRGAGVGGEVVGVGCVPAGGGERED